MTDLFDLLADTAPYQKHSPTSKAAAADILPRAGTLRRAVYDFIVSRHHAGATDEEIQNVLGLEGSTERPRRIELQRGGLIEQRVTWPTRRVKSGKQAAVWVAIQEVLI